MRDIAIIGKAGSGKDTVSSILSEYIPNLTQLAFAEPLKRYYHKIFPHVPTEPKPRQEYQWFGQVMRQRDPYVWVRLLENKYREIKKRGQTVVITDVRQTNEYDFCWRYGFFVIKVVASDETRIERMKERGDSFDLPDLNHETERYIDYFPYNFIIHNDGSVEELRYQIKRLADALIWQE